MIFPATFSGSYQIETAESAAALSPTRAFEACTHGSSAFAGTTARSAEYSLAMHEAKQMGPMAALVALLRRFRAGKLLTARRLCTFLVGVGASLPARAMAAPPGECAPNPNDGSVYYCDHLHTGSTKSSDVVGGKFVAGEGWQVVNFGDRIVHDFGALADSGTLSMWIRGLGVGSSHRALVEGAHHPHIAAADRGGKTADATEQFQGGQFRHHSPANRR